MSFNFVAAGTVDQVRRQVRHAVNFGSDDFSLLDGLRHYLLVQLEHWPATTQAGYEPGLVVEAAGHRDTQSGYLNLKIRPLSLPREGTDARPQDH